MPLKRTPPATPQQVTESDTNLSSAPATDTENECPNVTNRPRPRKRQHDDELSAFMLEIRKSIETLTKQQVTIQQTVKDIQKQNIDIKNSMDFISKQYEDMKKKFSKMESERKTQLAYIQGLEIKIENLERTQRQASIEIRNIPVQKKENKQDLLQLVKNLGDSIDVGVDESQIRDVFRLKTKKENNQPIIVDLTTVVLKEKILTSLKNFNKTKKERKLNTGDLKIDGDPRPVFVAECLTQTARKLYFLAREFSKNYSYAFCWTAHGKVFLRKEEAGLCRRIDTEADLEKLRHLQDQ